MIVVTGAAGFIGSNIVAELEEQGVTDEIAAADWFHADDRWRNVAKRALSHIVSPEELLPFLDLHATRINAVIHMGAISSTTERDVDLLLDRNVRFTVALWDWCALNAVPFLYASSAATYGNARECVDDPSIAALKALAPLNAYGWSKKVVDLMFAQRAAAGAPTPPHWVGLKFFNVYGPNEYHKGDMRSVVAKLHPLCTAGEPMRLFRSHRTDVADGGQSRDFIYVRDCARIVVALLRRPDVSGILNVGTGIARPFSDLAKAVAAAAERKAVIAYVDMPETLRPNYQYWTEADTRRLADAKLGVAMHDLESGVGDYVTRYLAADDVYR